MKHMETNKHPHMVQKREPSTVKLNQLISDKRKITKNYKDAINSHITLKQKLLHKSNEIKLNPAQIQEELELKKLPTEKQTQAYIDEKYSTLTDELAISKENINLIKKDLELLDDEISLFKYKIQMELKEW